MNTCNHGHFIPATAEKTTPYFKPFISPLPVSTIAVSKLKCFKSTYLRTIFFRQVHAWWSMPLKWNHYGHQHEHNYSFSPCFFQKNVQTNYYPVTDEPESTTKKACFRQHVSSVVEHEMKKPDSVLMLVQFPSAAGGGDFSSSQLSVQTLMVLEQSSRATAYIYNCIHVKNPQRW